MSRIESIKTTSLKANIKYSVWDDITRAMGSSGKTNYFSIKVTEPSQTKKCETGIDLTLSEKPSK